MNRTLLLGTAWTASAGAAVGLGFLAVSLVDASASPTVRPIASSAPESRDGSSLPSTSAAPALAGEKSTLGGTVYADCGDDSSSPTAILAGAPAAGWWVDDSSKPGQVEFKSATQSIEVTVTCVGGVPQFAVEGPRADDNGGGNGGTSTPAAPSTGDRGRGGADDGPAHDVGDDHGGGSNSGSGGSGSGGTGSGGSGSGGSGSGGSGSGGHGSDD